MAASSFATRPASSVTTCGGPKNRPSLGSAEGQHKLLDAVQNIELSPNGPCQVGDRVTVTSKSDPQRVPAVCLDHSRNHHGWPSDQPQKFSPVSGDCYLRLNAPRPFFRTTEIPFQIRPGEKKPYTGWMPSGLSSVAS